jgi:hypothetical protein
MKPRKEETKGERKKKRSKTKIKNFRSGPPIIRIIYIDESPFFPNKNINLQSYP